MDKNPHAELITLLERYNKHLPNNHHQPSQPFSTSAATNATLPSPLEILSSMIPPIDSTDLSPTSPNPGHLTRSHPPHSLLSSVYPTYNPVTTTTRLPVPSPVVVLPPPRIDDPATSAPTPQTQTSGDGGCCAECCPVIAAEIAAMAPPASNACCPQQQDAQRYPSMTSYAVISPPQQPATSGSTPHPFAVARLGTVSPATRVSLSSLAATYTPPAIAPYPGGPQQHLQGRSVSGDVNAQNGAISPAVSETNDAKKMMTQQQDQGEDQQQWNQHRLNVLKARRRPSEQVRILALWICNALIVIRLQLFIYLLMQRKDTQNAVTKQPTPIAPRINTDNNSTSLNLSAHPSPNLASFNAPAYRSSSTPPSPIPTLNPSIKRKEPTPPPIPTFASQLTTHTTTTARCLWSTCAAVFRSLDELIPHLCKLHVGVRTASSSVAAVARGSRCRWAACSTEKEGSDELISHLCADHLGYVDPTASTDLRHACQWAGCSNRFATFDELTGHVSEDHVGQGRSSYVCNWKGCDRKGRPFTQRQKVMRHIQTHTGDKPYQCNVCQKRFSEANIMTQHMRTHTGEKPFRCPEPDCGRQFSISGALTIHRRVHSGERPFRCRGV
ncbi:hypothetical protein BC936DRAFT_139081 [Jimgerdemannia flammicorona]|uniref:C2H2-type domain-containing protein n=1 Tax=Jimgerdemannia flammicorona TaxID=994334 RepID=A0A433BAQ8_9FUNG|nr:hypothetical protein BC936DRAFT_139081 [Jimgerdemannia flammicorona]